MTSLLSFSLPLNLKLLLLLASAISGAVEAKECFTKAIYAFGDSITDTGNLGHEGSAGFFVPFNLPPYGETYFKKPTGRCSDGLLIIDFLAMAFNLSLINPYLDQTANFENGVNFAVAGATAVDASFYASRGIVLPINTASLSTELQWFKTYLSSICSTPTACAGHFESTLFIVGEIGGNDYSYAVSQGRSLELETLLPSVVQSTIDDAKQLIDAGAVNLLVPGNFPWGCFPASLTPLEAFHGLGPAVYDEHGCSKSGNAFAMQHNQLLMEGTNQVRQTYPNITIIYADYYHAFMYLLNNASQLGFDTSSLLKACCGIGGEYNFDLSQPCGTPAAQACADPSQRISWDGIHLTQQAYKYIAQYVLTENIPDKWKC